MLDDLYGGEYLNFIIALKKHQHRQQLQSYVQQPRPAAESEIPRTLIYFRPFYYIHLTTQRYPPELLGL